MDDISVIVGDYIVIEDVGAAGAPVRVYYVSSGISLVLSGSPVKVNIETFMHTCEISFPKKGHPMHRFIGIQTNSIYQITLFF